ncbi:MAG: SRPBCC family protein [Gammaproteobacteria bacterium]|nr:SRPBCC family protein [Gammaproteobacteria bacterium]
MPQITKELTVNAPIDAAWALVSDMERFSLCIPGCKEVRKISDTEFDWVMETKVLHTTRKVTARTRAEVMRAPNHSEFAGEGRLFERSNHYKLTIRGTTDLEALATGTRIVFSGDVRASGVGGAIIDKVASGQLDELFDEFGKNVRAALGDQGGPPETAADASTPTAGAGRWRRWWLAAALLAMIVALAVALI